MDPLIQRGLILVAMLVLLYIFVLYVYFFPTPLTQPFVDYRQASPKNASPR